MWKKIKEEEIQEALKCYKHVATIKTDGVSIRIFRPGLMKELPAEQMRTAILSYVIFRNESYGLKDKRRKRVWAFDNIDWGLFDIQTVKSLDPAGNMDIYVCSILMRPASREAYKEYCQPRDDNGYGCVTIKRRLINWWDSRLFDEQGGYARDFLTFGHPDGEKRAYTVLNTQNDIKEGTFES